MYSSPDYSIKVTVANAFVSVVVHVVVRVSLRLVLSVKFSFIATRLTVS